MLLINGIKNLSMEVSKVASLDVKSWYTNIPVQKCLASLEEHLRKHNIVLELPIEIIIKIFKLRTELCYFTFEEKYYLQKFGLPMGSPLSGLLACLYLEILESGPFKDIFPPNVTYFRYIDDAFVIYPDRKDIEKIKEKLNQVEETIKFTVEKEENGCLPFLDILFERKDNQLLRKPTCKNDLIHHYSHHSEKIKSGIIIGFFIRALRICSPQYLREEHKYIENTFRALQYPESLIQTAKRKAARIITKKNNLTESVYTRHLALPTNPQTLQLQKCLGDDQGSCGRIYIGETSLLGCIRCAS